MAHATISHLCLLIRTLNYVVPTHAAEEIEDDDFSLLDLENSILTRKIFARQRAARIREVKYLISGRTLDGASAEAVVKLGFAGKLIIITVYRV